MMGLVETFLVRLWVPSVAAPPGGDLQLPGLRGVVEGWDRSGSRPFVGPEQLAAQLETALAERLRNRTGRPQVVHTSEVDPGA